MLRAASSGRSAGRPASLIRRARLLCQRCRADRAVFLFALAATWLCASSSPLHAQSLRVQWLRERLTVVAENVPLADVLIEVARQTGSSVVGLEKVSGSVSIDVRDAMLLDAVRPLLADVDYVMRYSVSPGTAVRFKVWLYGPSNMAVTARPCLTTSTDARRDRRTSCDDGSQDVRAVEAAAPPIATDPFPTGPSPAEAEAARLQAQGFFNPDAEEGSLLGLAKAADAGVRVRALQTLALQNTRAGFQAIKNALDDGNPFVRADALELILNLSGPGPESARRLGDLLGHKDPAVRLSAAMALGEQSGAEAEFQLKRALDDDAVRDMAEQLLQQKEKQKEEQKEKQKEKKDR